jgi:hypothetical protein
MFIHLPDPHPGRCPNLRPMNNGFGGMFRCLERADDNGHVCRFPDPPAVTHIPAGGTGGTGGAPSRKPEPWVAPPKTHAAVPGEDK